ncbi:MAG: bifunctional pyr operon transcriptional regulator/uracil phosphoribosyltransferase PyrR [Ectothiorhodospiraceae bacterium]|nr:bifunctional pyr operon transcriptional regulator/uracil phosphoribosyltransferase PyrR [Ectothiorhodospiraceae bacterium]
MTELAPVETLLAQMAGSMKRLLHARGTRDPVMVGVHTGGAWVAERLHQALELREPLGTLDISFYRDDVSTRGVQPQVRPSRLPFTVDARTVILVDDVIHSGRTVRAALNEIFDYGRPDAVLLAVLVDRGGRELPIGPDVTGISADPGPGRQIKLQGPDPLELIIRDSA